MKPIPRRDASEWAAYNNRFSALLTWLPSLCFWLVVAGSVYGIHKSIQSQYEAAGIFIAVAVAYVVQTLNGVSVHYSMRWIASWFVDASILEQNAHQKVTTIDGVVGFLCICFTASICFFDFKSNQQASERAAHELVTKPDSIRVNTDANAAAIEAARLAVSAAEKAEQSERRAHEATVDADINRRSSTLSDRQAHLQRLSPLPAWAASELRQIAGRLRSLENERTSRKSAFVPKASNLVQANNNLAAVSGTNAQHMLTLQMLADSTNTAAGAKYAAKKDGYSTAMFWLYITAMLLWHFCHGMLAFRALRYDEQHPDTESALGAIIDTIRSGLSNWLWTAKAKIMEWMPEEEIHGITRTDLLESTNTQICQDVYHLILQRQGINEMLIYTSLRGQYDPVDIRRALRLLKTSRLVFENSHTWNADASQQAFFSGNNPSPAAAGAFR